VASSSERLLAIGDIHGCLAALETLAAAVPISDDDMLVTLGDYVDRGPDSRGVVEWLIERLRAERLIPLLGNHEVVMLAARSASGWLDSWREFGGNATLASYARDGGPGSFADVPNEHWQFFEHDCRRWHETPTHIFVHGGLDPRLPLDRQPDAMLLWEKFNNPPPHESGRIMICGHTAQKDGLPKNLGHAVCIDTWVYGEGWLTCLEPATGRYWQANQRGESRGGELPPP